MNGVGSPASVSNMSVPLNANSPSVGTPPSADQTMLDTFSKIEMVTMRHQLNSKKNKVDNYPIRKPNTYSIQPLSTYLSNASNDEDLKDDANAKSLSMSLASGSMNICKIRVLKFIQPQENGVSCRARTRMIMSEKPYDGTVAMHYGEIEDGDFLASEDYLPTLPNTHYADLLAAQLCSLMNCREGYVLLDDQIRAKPTRMNLGSASQSDAAGVPHNSVTEMQQYAEAVSGQQQIEDVKPIINSNASLNTSQNLLANARMLPPGNPQALQMSQGLFSGVSMPQRSQPLDPQPLLHHQQQHPQQQLQQQQLNVTDLILRSFFFI
ncbi:protein PHYTOCHROME-DEPENDENT LATE-FLOWERING-like [Corylus avellana]|uniref:protein PHYTOCHROME-DEPENDENT LATE-FLOWERING-like n=1 Tax=Corylus avellana TaxID=13451 RepID=UPI00286C686C|nr:protein PHYTOCHROME-DEPENDENT LATE-FLOWERING-like [Corylus avellana]